VLYLCLICSIVYYSSIAVLGRVDEKCAQREQTTIREHQVETADMMVDKPSVGENDILLPELQDVEITTEQSDHCTEGKLQGRCFVLIQS